MPIQSAAPPPLRRITVGQIAAGQGVNLDVQGDVTETSALICGRPLQHKMPDGLHIHGGDTVEQHPFHVDSSVSDGLSCIFFLHGRVDVTVGGRKLQFCASGRGDIAAATLITATREQFHRHSPARQQVRHLVISASRAWLDAHAPGWARASAHPFGFDGWRASTRIAHLVTGLLAPSDVGHPFANLRAEAQAIEIIAEAATTLTDLDAGHTTATGNTHQRALDRAKEFIVSNSTSDLSVQMIARQAGLSVSSLQSLFRSQEGCGVFTFVRKIRLDMARTRLCAGAITIAEASLLAGYTNPANFATAFRRQFGCSPRKVRPLNAADRSNEPPSALL